MQNPFTTTFSKIPEYTYIHTEKTKEILENLQYDNPVYIITGARGSGKTVILAMIEQELKKNKEWMVFTINPTRNILKQIGAMLVKAGFTTEQKHDFFDIGIEIEEMIQSVQRAGLKILIGIDEISRTKEIIQFASEYGTWLRANYPIYLVCTGLYENIQELSTVKNLTFFRRATTIKTEPLNAIRMSEMYKNKLNIDIDHARELAKITKGYAYAFQELGVLCFRKKEDETIDDIIYNLKSELFAYSYEKIWEEMTDMDRFLAHLLVDKEEYKREEVLILMKDKAKNYSMYRDRLIKRGILHSRQGYISLALPFFADYIKEYC